MFHVLKQVKSEYNSLFRLYGTSTQLWLYNVSDTCIIIVKPKRTLFFLEYTQLSLR